MSEFVRSVSARRVVFRRRRMPAAARKLQSTCRLCVTFFLARTFGEYRHNVWNGEFDYAVYVWRGQEWPIALSPITNDPRKAEQQSREAA